jgi:hypothetical protein
MLRRPPDLALGAGTVTSVLSRSTNSGSTTAFGVWVSSSGSRAVSIPRCSGHLSDSRRPPQKAKECFESHTVDSWCLAASITGAKEPYTGLYIWTLTRLHRRQLHRFEPDVGGIRKAYGGTRSMGLSRGTLVKSLKYGLCYTGGSSKGRVSLHRYKDGKRVTQGARAPDFRVLIAVHWRGTLLPGL